MLFWHKPTTFHFYLPKQFCIWQNVFEVFFY